MASLGSAAGVHLFALATIFALSVIQTESKIVNCYWDHRSESWKGNGRLLLSDIDPFICTHITFATVGLNTKSWTIGDNAQEREPVNGTYKRFNDLKLKNPELKTLLCMSGSGGPRSAFKQLVADPVKSQTFIQDLVHKLNTYNFDGFDFDWEYPMADDKDNFMNFLKEMRTAFDFAERQLLISVAVGHNFETITGAYDPKVLSDTVDFINVMTYDYHGFSRQRPWTHVNAPLYSVPKDESPGQNSASALEFWVQKGADRHKMLIGIPAYGRGYMLKDQNQFGLFAPATGGLPTWTYETYCDKMRTESGNWTIYRNSRIASPYQVNGLKWFSIEDAVSARQKAEYIRDFDMGGAMIWTINGDDINGFCGPKFGIIRAVSEVFKTSRVPYP